MFFGRKILKRTCAKNKSINYTNCKVDTKKFDLSSNKIVQYKLIMCNLQSLSDQ